MTNALLNTTPREVALGILRGVTFRRVFHAWEDKARKVPADLAACVVWITTAKGVIAQLSEGKGITVTEGEIIVELSAAETAAISDATESMEDHYVLWVELPTGQRIVPSHGPLTVDNP